MVFQICLLSRLDSSTYLQLGRDVSNAVRDDGKHRSGIGSALLPENRFTPTNVIVPEVTNETKRISHQCITSYSLLQRLDPKSLGPVVLAVLRNES